METDRSVTATVVKQCGLQVPKRLPQKADGGLGLCNHNKPHACLKGQQAGRAEVLSARA